MIIIGITGTLGSGKGTIVEYLVNKKGFAHFSVRQYLLDEIQKRNLQKNRDSMVVVANELRKKNTPSFITDQLFKKAQIKAKNAIIESIRTPGEVDSLRSQKNFFLIAVDADPKIRFERITSRASETDHVDYETFIENETREMSSNDPNKQNLGKCIEMADVVIRNDDDVSHLYKQVENLVFQINENK